MHIVLILFSGYIVLCFLHFLFLIFNACQSEFIKYRDYNQILTFKFPVFILCGHFMDKMNTYGQTHMFIKCEHMNTYEHIGSYVHKMNTYGQNEKPMGRCY